MLSACFIPFESYDMYQVLIFEFNFKTLNISVLEMATNAIVETVRHDSYQLILQDVINLVLVIKHNFVEEVGI